jgi:putative transposase
MEAPLPEAKRAHPNWGPRKILPSLARRRPTLTFPAASTAGALCHRAGLRQSRQRRRRPRHPGAPPLQAEAPNAVWTADFKGQCRTGEGLYGSPLTVAAAYSRFLRRCAARRSTKHAEARPLFARLFQAYGLPQAIRTDHGAPFAPPAFCGLRKLSVWWIKLGIRHQRIAPGRPAPNGAHARLHRTLKTAATRPPECHQRAQQARGDRCRREYHTAHPHEALAYRTPASRYRPSPRLMPTTLPTPASPGHSLVRRVSHAATFRFQTRPLFISDTSLQEDIAWEETGDGLWSIYCDDVLLARLDERHFRRSA